MALEIKWVRYPRVRPCNESIRTSCCRGWNRSVVQNQSGSSLFLSTSMANRVWIVLICAYRASYGVYLLVFTKVSVGLHAHKTILRFRDGRVFSSRREVFSEIPSRPGSQNLERAHSYTAKSNIHNQLICARRYLGLHFVETVVQTFLEGRTVPEIIALV